MEVKYASKPIGKMSPAELIVAANAMMLKIHAITGWAIPEPAFAQILKDQFIKKMQESYANVNTEEIEYAFRQFGTEVKDWGKTMNLSLIDEVMIPYLESRRRVSNIEEQKKVPMIEHKEDTSETAMQEWFNKTSQQVKEGQLKIEFIPMMLFEWLTKKGKIRDYEKYQAEAAIHIGKHLATLQGQGNETEVYREYKSMFQKGYFEGKYIKEIEDLAKKMCVWDYILKN